LRKTFLIMIIKGEYIDKDENILNVECVARHTEEDIAEYVIYREVQEGINTDLKKESINSFENREPKFVIGDDDYKLVGDKYKYINGNEYIKIAEIDDVTLYHGKGFWIRPTEMFNGMKSVDNIEKKRFTLVEKGVTQIVSKKEEMNYRKTLQEEVDGRNALQI